MSRTVLTALLAASVAAAQDRVGLYVNPGAYVILALDLKTHGPRLRFPFGRTFPAWTLGIPTAGDWNGDGRDTVGVYLPTGRLFRLRNRNRSGPPDVVLRFPAGFLGEFEEVEGGIPRTFPLAGNWGQDDASPPRTGYPWPTADPARQGLDPAVLREAVAEGRSLTHLHSLLVVRNGFLVLEAYFHGWDAALANNVKSVSKSLLSCLFGIAWGRRLLPHRHADPLADLRATPVGRYLPRRGLPRAVTLYQLLTMTAGFRWRETPFPPDFLASRDWVGYVLTQPRVDPGVFRYSTGLSHVAAAVLARVAGMPPSAFARRYLLRPLGIEITRWGHEPVTNRTATDFGGAEVYLRPRDLARFGALYLGEGGGAPAGLLPPAWRDRSTRALVGGCYGLGWWVQRHRQRRGGRTFAGFHALGYGGQHVFVFPALRLVVVMTSRWLTRNSAGQIAANKALLGLVLDAVR